MAATHSNIMETASSAGPRFSFELLGTSFQLVPGVPAPNRVGFLASIEDVATIEVSAVVAAA